MYNNQLFLQESYQDLKEDFEELLYLTNHFLSQLTRFTKDINRIKKDIRPESYRLVEEEVRRIGKRLKRLSELIVIARSEATRQSLTHASSHSREILLRQLADQNNIGINSQQALIVTKFENKKKTYFDLIRTQAGLIGSLITSLDWQSPSFLHSQYSQAGKQTGKIKGTINDYKRDTHLDEEEFEKAYIREYIDAPLKWGFRALMTSSGMSAFTTIFNFLLMEGKISGKILLGKSSYFQYKQLLVSALKNQIVEIDEPDTNAILQAIKQEKPGVIFLDSLCNAKDIPIADLTSIINYLIHDYKKDIYLVIDNTGLSVAFQPFKIPVSQSYYDPGSLIVHKKLHIILFESLMKYVHFGLDRVTGGIIVAKGNDATKLFEYRKHLGTNLPDASVYAFPTPNRVRLEKRLNRLDRNASLLSHSIQEYIQLCKDSPLEKIVYPGRGSFFNLEFRKKSVRLYKRFIDLVIKEAKKEKVDMVAGTSFGLNTTRIYLTSLWTKYGEPFVRVSVGTENRLQIEALKQVFLRAINKFSHFLS